MAERLRREPLSPPWSYAVTADGRVFFINDETQRTTWIHPVTDEPVETGLLSREDLAKGWQQGHTTEGAIYFVDHNKESTTFYHPTSSTVEVATDSQFHVKLTPDNKRNATVTGPPKTEPSSPSVDKRSNMDNRAPSTPEGSTSSPATPKVKNRVIPKNVVPQVKRRKDDTVTMKGWLHKMGSKFKVWRKVWCVISDFCLFYYKGPNDVTMQGSIVLPSYDIKLVEYADKATKKYAFKCCHKNMRTVIFAAESQQDMKQWMAALASAAKVQMDLGYGEPPVNRRKEVRVSDDEDAGFSNFSQPTQSEIDHNTPRSDHEEDERPNSGYESRDDRGRPQSYQQNGYMRQDEIDRNNRESEGEPQQRGHRSESDPHGREESRNFVDESATEDESNRYSDNDIDEVYSEDSRRDQTNDEYSLSRDKDQSSVPIGRSENQEVQRRSAHDLRSPGQESLNSDGQSYHSSQELHRNPDSSHRQPNSSHRQPNSSHRQPNSSHRQPNSSHRQPNSSHRQPDSSHRPDDRHHPDDYQRATNRRHDSDMRSNYSRDSRDNTMSHLQDNKPYSSRDSLPSSRLSSPSNAEVPQNYRTVDSSSQHSYASQRQDDSGSQNSRESQRRDEVSSQQSYDGQRSTDSRPSSSRTTSPPSNKDHVDGGHIHRKRPDDLKFDFKHNNNYQVQRNGLSSPEQRSVLQSPWDQDPPLLSKEQRSAINSPVTYNPPRPENDTQPLRDGQAEFRKKDEFPEQRSYLQSPMVQSNIQPSLSHEQRATINSPMVYGSNAPQWPSQSMIDHRKMDSIDHSERITPQKANAQHMAPSLSRSSTLDSKRPTSSQARPGSRSGYTDETDIGPSRKAIVFSPPIENELSSRSREDVRNVYNATEGNISRQSSRAGDYRERSAADSYYGSQNGSRDPRDGTSSNRNNMRKSSGYDSYGDDSQAIELSTRRNRSGYSSDTRGRDYSLGTKDYVPHNQIGEYNNRTRNERQANGRDSRQSSIRSGRLPTERQKDYIPHDDVRRQRKGDYQHYDDGISSDSSSQQQHRPQPESKIAPSRQNYQESTPTKRRPESMVRAMEEKQRHSRGPSRRTTQEIFESEGADQFPSMDDENQKTQPRTTNRFRKWQQKLQPYIILNTGTRVRLSISADDLLGQPHDELVLLLIQLRRDQANLRTMNEMIKTEMTKLTDPDLPADSPTKARARRHSLKNPSQDFTEEELYLLELNQQKEEVEKEIEISSPLVSLVDNLVRMGSLYGGQNEMLAQQYYRDEVKKGMSFKPPKKLIEFSRSFQEQRMAKDLEKELEELETVEDRELEDKLSHLHFLDTRLQEISVYVTDLKEDKDKIEKALGSLDRQSQNHWDDPEAIERINEQQYRLERDLVKVREELAYRTRELESITVENNRIEHEVKLLRTKMEGAKKRGSQSEADEMKKTRMQIEKELQQVQGMISGLENQKNALALQMAGIRSNKTDNMSIISQSSSRTWLDDSESTGSYTVTDLDSMQSYDITQDIMPQRNIPPPVLQRKESIGRVKELKKQQIGSREEPIQQRHSTPVASSQAPALSPALTPLRIETIQNNVHPYSGVNSTPSSLLTTSDTSSGSHAIRDKKQTVRMRKRESERRKESDLRKKRSSSASGRRSGTFDIRYDYKPMQKRSGQKGLRRTASMPDHNSLMGGEEIVPKKQYSDETDRGIVSDSELEPKHLGPPPKILIPERYNPLSDDDYEELTEEEKRQRSERAEGIKKMLTSHSIYDWQETTDNEDEMEKIRRGLKEEKEKRENILQMKANLAEEIKQQTKLMGAQSMKVSPHTTGGEVER